MYNLIELQAFAPHILEHFMARKAAAGHQLVEQQNGNLWYAECLACNTAIGPLRPSADLAMIAFQAQQPGHFVLSPRMEAQRVADQIRTTLADLSIFPAYIGLMPGIDTYGVMVRFHFASELRRANLSDIINDVPIDIATETLMPRGRPVRPIETLRLSTPLL